MLLLSYSSLALYAGLLECVLMAPTSLIYLCFWPSLPHTNNPLLDELHLKCVFQLKQLHILWFLFFELTLKNTFLNSAKWDHMKVIQASYHSMACWSARESGVAEAGELPEPRSLKLQWATTEPPHSGLGNKVRCHPLKTKRRREKECSLNREFFIMSKGAQRKHPQQYINLYIKYRISPIFLLYMAACHMQENILMGQGENWFG